MAAGLESFGGFVLESILFKLDAKQAAAAACVSTRLRSAASDDALWRHFCARDFALYDQPLDADGALCPSFKVESSLVFLFFLTFINDIKASDLD